MTIGPIEGVDVHVGLAYYPDEELLPILAKWDEAVWQGEVGIGTDHWAGPPPVDDVSCDVISVTIRGGRDEPLDRFRTATCTMLLDDPEGLYSPWATSTDPTTYATIRPGIGLIVWVETLTGTYYRFTGVVESIVDVWPDPSDQEDTPHRVSFTAHDLLGEVAGYDGFEQPEAGAGELTGARVDRILTNAHIDYPRAIDPGTITVKGTTLAKNALDEIGLISDTELGAFFCSPDGVLTFLDQNGLVEDPRYTEVQAVFGDRVNGTEITYTDIGIASDSRKIRNLVGIAREGGTMQFADEPGSRGMFGTKTYKRTDLQHTDDADSTLIAEQHLIRFAYAANRIESLVIKPMIVPDRVDELLALVPLSLVEVRRRAHGFQVVATLQVQAIAESITGSDWTMEFTTFSAAGVFNVGRWNQDTWDNGLWGY